MRRNQFCFVGLQIQKLILTLIINSRCTFVIIITIIYANYFSLENDFEYFSASESRKPYMNQHYGLN